MKKNIAVIILAAGKGVRMNSALPKVMHPVCARPMMGYVLDLAASLKPEKSVCVLGHLYQEVKKIISPKFKIAIQNRLLGTADAVKQALKKLSGFQGEVLILYGDIPLLKKETIDNLLKHHLESGADATLLTAITDKPAGYGRVLRDKFSAVCGIVEEKDADDFQKDIKEINTGIIVFRKDRLAAALSRVRPDNRKREYYLTDAISLIYKRNGLIEAVRAGDINQALGINSRSDLAKANKLMQRRINDGLMKSGVSIIDPDSTFISFGAKIGKETVIYPFTVIEKDVKIGSRCSIGPFAHLREGTRLKDDCLVGNFLEIVRSQLEKNTWAKHFSYIGDSRIGKNVNIGAGTVTANFDGRKKNKTVISDRASIGSDTVLVAPVKVGRQAVTGAGAVVVKNVPAKTTVVGVPARILKKNK